MEIKGQVALVTGASEGIGRATAELLSKHGARVALAARSIAKLENLARGLPDAFAVEVDMTDASSISMMVDRVIEQFGRIDILVNNAGRALRASVADVDLNDFKSIVDLNLYGPLLAMQAVIPHMRQQGAGAIVNVSSNVSKLAIPTIGAYASTKYALNGLTLTARNELAAEGIVVSLVLPGQTATNFGRNAISSAAAPSGSPAVGGPGPDSPQRVAELILQTIRSGESEVAMPPAA